MYLPEEAPQFVQNEDEIDFTGAQEDENAVAPQPADPQNENDIDFT